VSKTKIFRNTAIALAVAGPMTAAMATNGMILEGYGPISTGMGGASQAIDHGNAAMAQNPATLSLAEDGSRLDVAVGLLGPKITASMAGQPSADSSGTAYMMPAVGYTRKANGLVYGVGVYAVGGMGTEYDGNSFLANPGVPVGAAVRSELGVGSLIFPVSYQVNPNLAVGGSVDFVWASMDLAMTADSATLMGMMTGTNMMLPPTMAAGRIAFSDGDKYTGAAKSNGYRAKLGATYKVSSTLTVGGSYQAKTSLSDMQTADGSASFSAYDAGGALLGTYSGKITVKNFQWPSVTSIGAGWQATPALLIAADVKSIGWAEVMKSFDMRFEAGGGFASFSMPQSWKDQTVVNLGAAWKTTSQLTLRAGLNIADNPIPEDKVNPLFPATVKSHYTLGAGYDFNKTSSVNASLVMAPAVDTTNAQGVKVSHSQTNWQLMYSHRF